MQWYCRRPSSLPPLVQAIAIIACQYYSTLLVSAQEAEVGNPCLICPNGGAARDDFAPYAWAGDPITCKELIDDAKLFETGSLRCAEYEFAIWSFCCNAPTVSYIFCTLCPNGITVPYDYEPFNDGSTRTSIGAYQGLTVADNYNCAHWLDYYEDKFYAESDTCTVGWGASIESQCCPTVASNPCIICPDGATAGVVPYSDDSRTCEDIINTTLTFDAESEMCLVYAKYNEYKCCPGSTTAINDYCNICPDGITAGDDFIPWSSFDTCKQLVQNAKIYENGTVGCNFHKGYEVSCCPNTPPSTTNWAIVGYIALVAGVVATLVGAAVAFARWKRKINSPIPTPAVPTSVATSTNTMS